jgi:hypothetical protein
VEGAISEGIVLRLLRGRTVDSSGDETSLQCYKTTRESKTLETVMLTTARALSVLSVVSTIAFAVVIIGSARLRLFLMGFEGLGIAAGYSFFLTAVTALLALMIVILRALLGNRAGFAQVARTCAISLLALLVLNIVAVM